MNAPRTSPVAPIGGVLMLGLSAAATGSRRTRPRRNGGAERLAKELEAAGLVVKRVRLPVSRPSRARANARSPGVERVESALMSLAEDCGENGHRIAVVAEDAAADTAVRGAALAQSVRAFVFLSGRLSRSAKDVLAEWPENPVLSVVSSEDEHSLRDLTDVYFEARGSDTDVRVYEGLGRGCAMLDEWAARFPNDQSLERTIALWVHRQLTSVGRAREVSFMTEDGWKIFGNLVLPDCGDGEAAGVILLHSGRSDRFIYANLERLLVREGFAVLNIDWRGRGKSVNKGSYFTLTKEKRAEGTRDAKAAEAYLVSQRQVDRERIGYVGVAHGAEHAIRSSIGDPRTKAFVVMSGYDALNEEERAYVTRQARMLYITSSGHTISSAAMYKLYQESTQKLTRFKMFDGGALGYQLFEIDDKLEREIVGWLKEALAA